MTALETIESKLQELREAATMERQEVADRITQANERISTLEALVAELRDMEAIDDNIEALASRFDEAIADVKAIYNPEEA